MAARIVADWKVSRFAMIGVASTLIYAVVALGLSDARGAALPSSMASIAAYAIAAVFSYNGHKYFTFLSAGQHRLQAPRFAAVALLGLSISYMLPTILSGLFGFPSTVPIIATCILVPLINYVVLNGWVFAGSRKTDGVHRS